MAMVFGFAFKPRPALLLLSSGGCRVCVCVCMYVCLYVCLSVCLSVCLYVCMRPLIVREVAYARATLGCAGGDSSQATKQSKAKKMKKRPCCCFSRRPLSLWVRERAHALRGSGVPCRTRDEGSCSLQERERERKEGRREPANLAWLGLAWPGLYFFGAGNGDEA